MGPEGVAGEDQNRHSDLGKQQSHSLLVITVGALTQHRDGSRNRATRLSSTLPDGVLPRSGKGAGCCMVPLPPGAESPTDSLQAGDATALALPQDSLWETPELWNVGTQALPPYSKGSIPC